MASAFLAFTSLNMRTASAGSAHERIQRVLSDKLRHPLAPNGQQCHVEASKTFPHLGERRANGSLVFAFPITNCTVRSVTSKIHILCECMKSVKYRAAGDMLRRCAGQSHFCVHGGVVSIRWEGNLQETLFPPIELVKA